MRTPLYPAASAASGRPSARRPPTTAARSQAQHSLAQSGQATQDGVREHIQGSLGRRPRSGRLGKLGERIMASLAQKDVTQATIVRKLASYVRQNQTKKALWELENMCRTLYILDFIDDVHLRVAT